MHHLTYARIYRERPEDLAQLCGACDGDHGSRQELLFSGLYGAPEWTRGKEHIAEF